jgi:hypothetical protein
MTPRIRHCVECPKCPTRYLIGFSPYRNGSYLLPLGASSSEEWTLYCSCARLAIPSGWCWGELKMYVVSGQAHSCGYGLPEEIAAVSKTSHRSS